MTFEQLKAWIERYEAASFVVSKRLDSSLRECIGGELTLEQLSILRYIHASESCTSTELAEQFRVGKSAITAIITRLENKGLIERDRNSKDRRVVYLKLTKEGESLRSLGEENIHQAIGTYLNNFSELDIELFISYYERLAAIILTDKERDGGND